MRGEISTFTSVLIVITLVLCVASWLLVLVGYIKDRRTRKRTHYALIIMLVLSVPVTAQTPWQPPRTPDGQPDMQGMWRSGTDADAAVSLEGDHSRWAAQNVSDDAIRPAQRESSIIDPPDGKIPYQPWALQKREEFIANMMVPTKREHVDSYARNLLAGGQRKVFAACRRLLNGKR